MAGLRIWVKNMGRETDIHKKMLRQQISVARMALSPTERTEKCRRIYHRVTEHPAFVRAKTVYCFIDAKGEVDTHQIIRAAWQGGKRVAAPRIEGKEMQFFYIDDFDHLEKSRFGIEEPAANCAPAEDMTDALMIMPGMVFDQTRNRIGYGGGYYDRFLAEHSDLPTIAVAFELQVIGHIPAEPHDIRPDILITEEQ